MQLFHRTASVSATFDDTNIVSAAGLVPAMALAVKTGLSELADEHLSVPGYFGANAGLKVTALVAGMLAGADSIDNMALLRHGGMKKLFAGAYAPSTLGSFLRSFTFGHVRQLDAVARRWLVNVAQVAPIVTGIDEYALVDIDDTIKEVVLSQLFVYDLSHALVDTMSHDLDYKFSGREITSAAWFR
jgi:hypothetical protein